MNDKRYRWILYVIVFVILSTVTIQVYWNYKNYLVSKQQLINDVQISLDNAVEAYYARLAENNTIALAFKTNEDDFIEDGKLESIIQKMEFSRRNLKTLDSIDLELFDDVEIYEGIETDSFFLSKKNNPKNFVHTKLKKVNIDSTSQEDFRLLTSKVIISMANNTLQLKDIDSLFHKELLRKNLNVNYGLSYTDFKNETLYVNPNVVESAILNTTTKSPFIGNKGVLTAHFTNETKIILKRILSGILLSSLLVLAVISCLFYLLKIIKHQKLLAEVTNDLISNITHEFKTPIATISVALESIKNFNVIDDKEKTKSYLGISNNQLSKLNVMVEKLLETATLDSKNLHLNKEIVSITDLLHTIIDKHQIQTEAKTISFHSSSENIMANIDVFHFENAINNIIDNAIKYGGDDIYVGLDQNTINFTITITDNGNSLTKINKDKIFEKFYRVSKGNTHDVKGFGIGLYYTKKIIEKHGGLIHLNLDNKQTTFKISLPNE